MPHQENCPLVRVGIWVKVRVSFRVGGNQIIFPVENCPPVRVRVLVGVIFGVGGEFSSGAIVLEPCLKMCRKNYVDYYSPTFNCVCM